MRRTIWIAALIGSVATLAPAARAETILRLLTSGGVPVQGLPVVIEDGTQSTVAITNAEGDLELPPTLSARAELVVPTGRAEAPVLRRNLLEILEDPADGVAAFGRAATGQAGAQTTGLRIEAIER
ncbi:hypothetical protein [Jannaschia ovalis]|uniref:Uncharacterized protein n=1 Tax=Jannaschia ovalis TaxID=3038773 RepID=A0ABY8LEY1_9RHOB|nr:hypothetical protein [Jannaschia sp. GRR-S6-38]WGH79854.1 hypothetical protein P8627_06220 [Jannaschia sp. GRR-S6-38]